MQAGQSWQEAAGQAGVQTSRTIAYRLLQCVRTEGEAALEDGRHGHPYIKTVAEAVAWSFHPSVEDYHPAQETYM